jgi:hypothetical protein
MTHELSWPAANLRRLQRHALLTPAPSGTDPAEIAAVICGAHAQVLSAAELSLALRIQAGTPTTVRQVLWKEHRLIKTSGPRGTVHPLANYLYAYGPATPQQFARRIGAPPSWAAEQFELHSRRLTKINFDGSPARQ